MIKNMLLRGNGGGGTFRKISASLACVAVVILCLVMYMALSRATIIVSPIEEPISAELLVAVKELNMEPGDVSGKIVTTTLEKSAVFTVSGAEKEAPGIAEGQIIIHNKHSKSQPLIKTTRFLSEGGVLFRLKEGVTVPAGGSVGAVIYADKEGADGNVGPGRFTIPGLSASLQKSIYGESTAAMTGGIRKVAVVTQQDVDDATKSLSDTLIFEAKDILKPQLDNAGIYKGVAYKERIILRETSVQPGEDADNFEVKLKLEVVGIAYGSALEEQASQTLNGMIYSDRRLISSNIYELDPKVESYNLAAGSAILKVAITGKTMINANSSVFDRQKLAGMNMNEVKEYLVKNAGIQEVEVKFFPFWLNKVPKLHDHIKVVVK